MKIETLIELGYYVSSIGFLIASLMMWMAVRKFGTSTLGSIFSYIFIGTFTFFVITVFQKLGADFFGISDESMDIWWHVMFYMALLYYFYGLKFLVGLGNAELASQGVTVGSEKKWGIFAVVLLVIIFIIPKWAEPIINIYNTSALSAFGLHHFIAFILAGVVGYYLVSAKKRIGMIGRAIANPMIVAIWALALQHFWELLNESWKVIDVTSNTGEGVEKIFLTIAAIAVICAAVRLKSFARG